jgi:hypothetical protein
MLKLACYECFESNLSDTLPIYCVLYRPTVTPGWRGFRNGVSAPRSISPLSQRWRSKRIKWLCGGGGAETGSSRCSARDRAAHQQRGPDRMRVDGEGVVRETARIKPRMVSCPRNSKRFKPQVCRNEPLHESTESNEDATASCPNEQTNEDECAPDCHTICVKGVLFCKSTI